MYWFVGVKYCIDCKHKRSAVTVGVEYGIGYRWLFGEYGLLGAGCGCQVLYWLRVREKGAGWRCRVWCWFLVPRVGLFTVVKHMDYFGGRVICYWLSTSISG